MTEKKNTEFEHTLKDILQPADPERVNQVPDTGNTSSKRIKPTPSIPQGNSRKYPKWLDSVVRVVATILVFFLLLLFAYNIVTR